MRLVLHLLRLVLALENLALRQQLAVFQRNVERPKLNDGGGGQAGSYARTSGMASRYAPRR